MSGMATLVYATVVTSSIISMTCGSTQRYSDWCSGRSGDYPLVHHVTTPDASNERFGLEYTADPEDETAAQQLDVRTVTEELSEEQEQLLLESGSNAMPHQGNVLHQ